MKVRYNAGDGIGLIPDCDEWVFKEYVKTHVRLSRCSSRTISSSREPSPFAHRSTQTNHICNSSIKVHGRVQSRAIITAVCGNDCRGGKKSGNREV